MTTWAAITLPIEISVDAQPHRNTHTNPIRYKFDQTDREVFESTLEAALSLGDIPELKSTQDIDKYADFIVTAISTAVDKAIPTSKSGRPESQPVSDETLASSIYSSRSSLMLRIITQPLFELITLLLCGRSLLF